MHGLRTWAGRGPGMKTPTRPTAMICDQRFQTQLNVFSPISMVHGCNRSVYGPCAPKMSERTMVFITLLGGPSK